MKLALYNKEFDEAVKNYQLKDERYSGGAANQIARCQNDSERFPVLIFDAAQLVGAFVLHLGDGPAKYGFLEEDVILLRGFSIDDRFRRRGYASQALSALPEFVHAQISEEVKRIVLAVNAGNKAAQKTYLKSGFVKLPQEMMGSLGKLWIMEKRQ